MSDLLITNARIVNEGSITESDIYIKNGRIDKIAADLSNTQAKTTLDANGKILIPGMIDDQVHFREPGLTHKGDIATESRAAVAGGITSFMEMPNVNPLTINSTELENKYQRAAQKSLANHAFYLGATNNNIDEIKRIDPKAACGVKVFMGASTGDMLVDNHDSLEQIFAHCPILIATHCEDTPTILQNQADYKKRYGDDIPIEAHPKIRSVDACYKSSSLAVSLAKKHGSQLHVLHLTTAKELALFTAGDVRDKKITAEVCVHHLAFNEGDYREKGNLIKCNPAIKTQQDQQALQQAVIDNVIDVIATDHAPHTWEEKQQAYPQAPAGLPLVQHALLSVLEHYHDKRYTLEMIVQKTSHAPADLFQVKERGYIREGYWADLVLLDIDDSYTVNKDNILYKCGWSPFEGKTFRSRIDTTLVNGNIIYQDGKIMKDQKGERLEFDR